MSNIVYFLFTIVIVGLNLSSISKFIYYFYSFIILSLIIIYSQELNFKYLRHLIRDTFMFVIIVYYHY